MFFLASGATQLGKLVRRGSAGPDRCHAAALRWVRVTSSLSVDSHINAALNWRTVPCCCAYCLNLAPACVLQPSCNLHTSSLAAISLRNISLQL